MRMVSMVSGLPASHATAALVSILVSSFWFDEGLCEPGSRKVKSIGSEALRLLKDVLAPYVSERPQEGSQSARRSRRHHPRDAVPAELHPAVVREDQESGRGRSRRRPRSYP